MCTILIGNEIGNCLTIEVLGRTHPDSNDYWDGNWLSTKVKIVSGEFEDNTSACLRSDEFESFLKGLKSLSKTLNGTAEYHSLEEWLNIKISGDGKGHLLAKGFVIDEHCEGSKLNFSISFDQTSLCQIIDALEKLLNDYPVIGR